jgi:hypothetical protein
MTPINKHNLSPEKQLQLFLMEHGYPYKDIPKILSYCPQLLNSFTIEQIGIAALTKIHMFKPIRHVAYIRPFMLHAAMNELHPNESMNDFIESAIAICSSDTIVDTFNDIIKELFKDLK